MPEWMDNRDRRLHENLQMIGRRLPRPKEASPEQIRRWVHLAQRRRRSILSPFAAFGLRTTRRWLISGAAAAAILCAVFLSFYAAPQRVTADDVFARLDSTLASRPVIRLTVKDVVFAGHCLNLELAGRDGGDEMYAEIDARSLAPEARDLRVALVLARQQDEAWALIRQLRWNGQAPLQGLIPSDGALLVHWPISSKTRKVVQELFPVAVRVADVRGLVNSLRRAVPHLEAATLENGQVGLEGVITRPEDLDLRILGQATDASNLASQIGPMLLGGVTPAEVQKTVALVKQTVGRKLPEEQRDAMNQRIDLLAAVALQQFRLDTVVARPERDRREQTFRQALEDLLTGAVLKIEYDPQSRVLRHVMLQNIGPRKGLLALYFDAQDFGPERLRRDRFADKPNVRILSRDELLQTLLMQLFLPSEEKPQD